MLLELVTAGCVGWLALKSANLMWDSAFGCRNCSRKEQSIESLNNEIYWLEREIDTLNKSVGEQTQQEIALITVQKNAMQGQIDSLKKDLEFAERKNEVVKFLNTASYQNLEDICGIGPRKTNLIIQKRPFKNFCDAKSKLSRDTLRLVTVHCDPELKP